MEKGTKLTPGLFAQTHNNSSRDYSKRDNWGKNIFNSSFPASLVAYMSYKGISSVYLKTDDRNNVIHDYISGTDLYRINPLSPDAFYNFEAGYSAFEKYYTGDREKIDLVMMDSRDNKNLIGLEIKLVTIPDSTTLKLTEDKYSCELVVRTPTINFLACSICNSFPNIEGRNQLKELLGDIHINHWEEIEEVLPHYNKINEAILRVCSYMQPYQTPLIVQPIWKTIKGEARLADDCLDVFVWSNLALVQLFIRKEEDAPTKLTRQMRSVIWLYLMLFEYSVYGQFDYKRIVLLHSYNQKNDKAFAISGTQTYPFLACDELTHPRISKYEIKNIILGGGQRLLSPERRFDAVLVYSPELFEQ